MTEQASGELYRVTFMVNARKFEFQARDRGVAQAWVEEAARNGIWMPGEDGEEEYVRIPEHARILIQPDPDAAALPNLTKCVRSQMQPRFGRLSA